MDLKFLIEQIVTEEFAKAPKPGDIDPTEESDSERPGMAGRPDDGMDMDQQHKMMHAENVSRRVTYDENFAIDDLVNVVRQRLGYGQSFDEIVDDLEGQYSVEEIYLAYESAKILDRHSNNEKDKEQASNDSFDPSLASSGKITEASIESFGFDDLDFENPTEAKPVDPVAQSFATLKRGDKIKVGKYVFDITNSSDNFTKVANLHGSKGKKYYIIQLQPGNSVNVYQGLGGTMDHGPEPRVSGPFSLMEMNGVSGGGAGMASSGKIAGSGPTGFSSHKSDHDMMWSGDEPYAGQKKKLTTESTVGDNAFSKATDLWFYHHPSGFSDTVLDAMEKFAVPVYKKLLKTAKWNVGNCTAASTVWKHVLKSQGIDAKVVSGFYSPNHEPGTSQPGSSDHVWLEIDGGIFDPTAGQFQGSIETGNYWLDDDTKAYGEQIEERILESTGFGGDCGNYASKLNNEEFNGEGKLVGAFNQFWWENFNRPVGHVAVFYDGKYYDVNGELDPDELAAWGMLDENDSDYQHPNMTENDFYDVTFVELTDEQANEIFGSCDINEEHIGTSGGVRYFQMGGSIPKNLYNRTTDGKHGTKEVGSAKFRGKTGKSSSKGIEDDLSNKKRWYTKEAKEDPTDFFGANDRILFGKYKNKKGRIKKFAKDEKGNPTVHIEPTPKGKKKDVEMGLYKIWKNQAPETESETVIEEDASPAEVYYHGTTAALNPGDMVSPPSETGSQSELGRKKNLDKVFFTKDPKSAMIYAGRAKHSLGGTPVVYVIQPIGDIQTVNAQPGTTVFMSPKAKVLKKL